MGFINCSLPFSYFDGAFSKKKIRLNDRSACEASDSSEKPNLFSYYNTNFINGKEIVRVETGGRRKAEGGSGFGL
jgi:hypothetical protein